MRNRIINGGMVISQRGSSFTPTPGGVYGLDRFSLYASSGTATVTQSTVAPAGFSNSLLWTQTSAGTRAAGDYYEIAQLIEANNTSDFGFGTSSASAFTLSFWVRSSITGAFSVGLRSSTAPWTQYVTTYTITSANTWQYVTIPIPGPTAGTWSTGISASLQIFWDLGSGSTYQTSTLNAWQYNNASNVLLSTTQTAFGSVAGAPTFYITGVQLEKGSTATPFEQRLYGTELALCQRYYEYGRTYLSGTSIGVMASSPYIVTKRATPTLVVSVSTAWTGQATGTTSAGAGSFNSDQVISLYNSSASAIGAIWTASAEL
jgi:hypothetical protein